MTSPLAAAALVYYIATTHTDPGTGVRTEHRVHSAGTFDTPGACRRFVRVDLNPNIEVKHPAGVRVGRQPGVTFRCLPEFESNYKGLLPWAEG